MKNKDEEWNYREFKTPEGDFIKTFNNTLHDWDGPAIVRADGKKEYYLYGRQHSLYDWKETQRDRIGLPPAKNPLFKASFQ